MSWTKIDQLIETAVKEVIKEQLPDYSEWRICHCGPPDHGRSFHIVFDCKDKITKQLVFYVGLDGNITYKGKVHRVEGGDYNTVVATMINEMIEEQKPMDRFYDKLTHGFKEITGRSPMDKITWAFGIPSSQQWIKVVTVEPIENNRFKVTDQLDAYCQDLDGCVWKQIGEDDIEQYLEERFVSIQTHFNAWSALSRLLTLIADP